MPGDYAGVVNRAPWRGNGLNAGLSRYRADVGPYLVYKLDLGRASMGEVRYSHVQRAVNSGDWWVDIPHD